MEINKIFKNKIYYQNRLKIILTYLQLEGKSVVDLGCGEMVLYDLIADQLNSYIGIDQFHFSKKEYFIKADIRDPELFKEEKFDFVFLVGVLDHCSVADKKMILEHWTKRYKQGIIISQHNEHSLINLFFNKTSVVNLKSQFINHQFKEIYLLKFPLLYKVYVLNPNWWITKYFSTEIISIIFT
jgi:2-polyprenyl-3-methyl-5-hydroxy-6-metoxy-1,4-benzoquinol methylase